MKRSAIKPLTLYKLAKRFIRFHYISQKNGMGGRPRDYPDAVILTIATVQDLGNMSFREALAFCGKFLPDVPALSTYHERLESFPKQVRKEFMLHLGT